ncbi:MAG: response regulator [Desulfobacterales bacterium]|nr:response regulator [Desulfobacterales bacterium]
MVSAIKIGGKDLIKGLETGADAYLAKPIDEYVLAAQIKTALRIKKAEDHLRKQKETLENMVLKRTDELMQTNLKLQREIDEHSLTEDKREQLQAQLVQAQKMESIGRLAGGVAHDFNNALSVIMGTAELVINDVDPDGQLREDLDDILMAAKRAADITRQLLAFARKQTISPEVLDLNENIQSLLKMLRRLIGEDIDLAWLPGANLWSVNIDPSQIDQVLANLCVNAQDAIEGVGKITIETRNLTLDKDYCIDHACFIPGEYIQLSVTDSGCGMNKKTLDNIFEPFFTTKDVDKGTGLGMAMVYGIIRQNNGFINVDSEPGKGATIKIYLPRHESTVAEIHKGSTKEIQSGQGETILVVEDDPSILNIMQTILKGLNYTVLTSNAPEKTMSIVKKYAGTVHLLITDVIMPKMNGHDMAELLRSTYPDLKCIFMSGYTADVIAHHGVLDKGIRFIQKPFSRRELAEIIRKVLDEN